MRAQEEEEEENHQKIANKNANHQRVNHKKLDHKITGQADIRKQTIIKAGCQ